MNYLKGRLTGALLLIFLAFQATTSGNASETKVISEDDQAVVLLEVRYEKLMRIYLNKIKLAFSETDDARTLAILNQFLPEFNQRTEAIKAELKELVKEMPPRETEKLYRRLSAKSHTEELVSLLFDERIASRLVTNPELEIVMNQLQSKSTEVEKAGREVIAIGE